jgi:hypothetical protein
MGGKFSKLEASILELEEKIKKEESAVKRYELRRIFRRKIAKLENRREDQRRRNAILSGM